MTIAQWQSDNRRIALTSELSAVGSRGAQFWCIFGLFFFVYLWCPRLEQGAYRLPLPRSAIRSRSCSRSAVMRVAMLASVRRLSATWPWSAAVSARKLLICTRRVPFSAGCALFLQLPWPRECSANGS